jgi:hypothetical protein
LLLNALARKGVEFGDENSLEACLQGVISTKVHRKHRFKAFKSVYLGLYTILNQRTQSAKTTSIILAKERIYNVGKKS